MDPASLAPMDRVPRVFASSLSDWDAFGHTWASLIADKAAVAPRIQALADMLTAGTSDRHEQAKRLYDWVGTNIRWVAIQIGNGTIGPHTADERLLDGYGDNKDQVMPLVALMRAKDLAARPGTDQLRQFLHVAGRSRGWRVHAPHHLSAGMGHLCRHRPLAARRSERYRSRITASRWCMRVLQGEVRRQHARFVAGCGQHVARHKDAARSRRVR